MRTCSNDSGLIMFLFLCKLSVAQFQTISVQKSISFLAKGDEMAEEGAEMPVVPRMCC